MICIYVDGAGYLLSSLCRGLIFNQTRNCQMLDVGQKPSPELSLKLLRREQFQELILLKNILSLLVSRFKTRRQHFPQEMHQYFQLSHPYMMQLFFELCSTLFPKPIQMLRQMIRAVRAGETKPRRRQMIQNSRLRFYRLQYNIHNSKLIHIQQAQLSYVRSVIVED